LKEGGWDTTFTEKNTTTKGEGSNRQDLLAGQNGDREGSQLTGLVVLKLEDKSELQTMIVGEASMPRSRLEVTGNGGKGSPQGEKTATGGRNYSIK